MYGSLPFSANRLASLTHPQLSWRRLKLLVEESKTAHGLNSHTACCPYPSLLCTSLNSTQLSWWCHSGRGSERKSLLSTGGTPSLCTSQQHSAVLVVPQRLRLRAKQPTQRSSIPHTSHSHNLQQNLTTHKASAVMVVPQRLRAKQPTHRRGTHP